MVTQRQLDELGSRSEQEIARNLVERRLQNQGINLGIRSIGTKRLFQLFINQPEAVRRQRASGTISIGEARVRRVGGTFVGRQKPKPTIPKRDIKRFLFSDRALARFKQQFKKPKGDIKRFLFSDRALAVKIKELNRARLPIETKQLIEKKLQQQVKRLAPVKKPGIIKRVKISKKLPIKLRDIMSLGLTREMREREKINEQIESYNKDIEEFEERFLKKELEEEEFALAKKEELKLNKQLESIEQQEKEIKIAIPTKISKATQSSANELRKERVKIIKEKGVKALIDPRLKKIDRKLQELALTQSAISTGIALLLLPETLKSVIKEPSQLKKIPSSIGKAGIKFGKLAMISPNEAIAKIGAEILLLKGAGKSFKIIGKVSGKTRARLSPKFKGIEKSVITVPSQVKGKTINIKIGRSVKRLAEPLRKQVRLAGREVTAVSAQADRLIRLIKRTKIVRKPIPGEAKLTRGTKSLLKKFDKRRIGKRDLIELDRRIKRETGRAGSLLERSFFADPRGRLRPSRLGLIEKEATLSDILKGEVTFKTQKPQVLIFEKVIVEKFPKALKGIERKLKAGKTLTRNEANKLLQFQLKKSAKFKPIGHLTREPEISLAPGEIIKKGKTIAVTIIQGRRVPIISAKVVKAKPGTKILLNKVRTGKITTKELKKLRKNLKKETGFKTSLSRGRIGKPRVRLPKPIPRRPPKRREPKRTRRPPKRIRRPAPRRPVPGRPAPRRAVGRPVPGRPVPGRPAPRRAVPRRAVPGRPAPPIKPFPLIPRVKKRVRKKRKPTKRQAYQVLARPLKRKGQKRKPKLIKVSKVPLTKKRARDLRNYIADTSLSRTARIKPIKGKPTTSKLKVPKGYSRKTFGKFRRYRIVKGKRIPLKKGKIIELGRHLLDTRQEKKRIGLKRRIAQIRKPSKRKSTKRKSIKRKTSPKRSGGIFG